MERRIIAATINGATRYIDPARRGIPAAVLDYQTGDFSQWPSIQVERPEQLIIVSSPARPGYTHSAKFSIQLGDFWIEGGGTWNEGGGTIRGEASGVPATTQSAMEGTEQWFAWSAYFPEDFLWDIKDFFLYTEARYSEHGTPSSFIPSDKRFEPEDATSLLWQDAEPHNWGLAVRADFRLGSTHEGCLA